MSRIDRALAPRIPAEVRVDGVTVHACLDQVARRHDAGFLDLVLDHVPGQNWKLSERASVLLNGADVRTAQGTDPALAAAEQRSLQMEAS